MVWRVEGVGGGNLGSQGGVEGGDGDGTEGQWLSVLDVPVFLALPIRWYGI